MRGRPRSSKEQLFTAALVEQLDLEQERRGMDQRAFADYLHVHESLLSLYRSGQRIPAITGFLHFEEYLPGFLTRVVAGYFRQVRRSDLASRVETTDADDEEPERAGPPTDRVGVYHLEAILR